MPDHRDPHRGDDSASETGLGFRAGFATARRARAFGDERGLERQRRHERVDLGLARLERGELLAFEIAPRRQLDAERIDLPVAHHDLVVQMRSGRNAGRADERDHLALPHAHADAKPARITRQMPVRRLVRRGVADAHVAPVSAVPADELDDAVARRHHRRAGRRAEIDAAMHARIAEHRMAAPAVARGDARAVDRRLHQHALAAPALRREVVGGVVVARREAVELLALARERQRRVGDVAAFDHLPVGVGVVRVEQLELVARAHLALEVDVVGEDLDQADDHGVGNALRLGREIKAAVDRARRVIVLRGQNLTVLPALNVPSSCRAIVDVALDIRFERDREQRRHCWLFVGRPEGQRERLPGADARWLENISASSATAAAASSFDAPSSFRTSASVSPRSIWTSRISGPVSTTISGHGASCSCTLRLPFALHAEHRHPADAGEPGHQYDRDRARAGHP